MKKLRILLVAAMMVISLVSFNHPVSAYATGKWEGYTARLVEADSNCPDLMQVNIPNRSCGNEAKISIEIDLYDAGVHRVTNPNYTYELYYQQPGQMPQGVTVVNQYYNIYDCVVDCTAEGGNYELTVIITDPATGYYVKDVGYLQLYRDIKNVTVTFSDGTGNSLPASQYSRYFSNIAGAVVLPTNGLTKKIYAHVEAYDYDNCPYSVTSYALNITDPINPRGITITNLGSGDFIIRFNSNASANALGLVEFDASVRDTGNYHSSNRNIYRKLELVSPILTSVSGSCNDADIPLTPFYTEPLNLVVNGFDQYGGYMAGCSYSIVELPQGVTCVAQSGGSFDLAVDCTAQVGVQKAIITVKYGNVKRVCNVYFELKGVTSIGNGSSVPNVSMKLH